MDPRNHVLDVGPGSRHEDELLMDDVPAHCKVLGLCGIEYLQRSALTCLLQGWALLASS